MIWNEMNLHKNYMWFLVEIVAIGIFTFCVTNRMQMEIDI